MTFRPNRESTNAWIELLGKATGIVCVLVGIVVYGVTGRAETIVFSTGALLVLGGAGFGLVEVFRRPPSDDPPSASKENA